MSHTANTKLVILGGGASGLLIAMKLANTKYLDITLIDSKSFYEYTPALCSVLYEPTEQKFEKHFKSITFDYAPFLAKLNIKFILGKIKSVRDEKVYLVGHEQPIDYDYVVICTGSSYAEPWKTVSPNENDPCLDAAARLDFLRQQRQKYQASQDILCIGGGPVGVELVTEIACRSPTKKITLVEANEFVLASAPSDIGKHAQNIIKAKPSIRLINQEMASKKDRQEGDKSIYETDKSHTVIEADLVYNCIGVKPNSSFLDSAWLNEKQQVVVDETLKVPHTSNVFAVGDINSVEEPKMFYTAHIQAVHFTRNMRRLLNNAPCNTLLPYRGCRVNMVVSMGPSHAVGHVAGINLTGWPLETKDGSRLAAVAKYFIERITMDDFGLKLPINDLLYYTQGKRTGHLHSS